MNRMVKTRLPLFLSLIAALAALLAAGCGGGGGGNSSFDPRGRSFASSDAARTIAISVDALGRFTLFARDDASIFNGVAVQGSIGTDGAFTAQTSGGILFSGQVSGQSITGTATQTGATLFSFTAGLVDPGRAQTSALSATYSVSGAAGTAMVTVDVTGHATLFATVNNVTGGGLVNVSETGAFESADGSGANTGQMTLSGTNLLLRIDKLNGTALNANLTLSPTTRAKWTFLVFLNGANNLDEFGPLNVNQMEKVGSTRDLNIVVQWKRANCGNCGSPEWTGTRRYFITKDANDTQVTSPIVQNMGTSVDMGDWRELRNFILWGQQQYPADHYALVIWNHGAGWRPTRAGGRLLNGFPRSVSIDDSTNSEIQTWQLPQALTAGQRLNAVIFDASLMQMTEVAYEIRQATDVLVGSEESPPGEGYVYDRFLADLAGNPAMTARELGTKIVQRTLEAYGHSNNLTQSALDTTKLDNLAAKLDTFADTLEANISGSRTGMVFARRNAQNYAYPDNKDLWHYAQLIKENTASTSLQQAAADVQTAIAAAVIAEDHGSVNANSHGIAIYVPAPIDYLTSYSNLALARATDWDRWLQIQPAN